MLESAQWNLGNKNTHSQGCQGFLGHSLPPVKYSNGVGDIFKIQQKFKVTIPIQYLWEIYRIRDCIGNGAKIRMSSNHPFCNLKAIHKKQIVIPIFNRYIQLNN